MKENKKIIIIGTTAYNMYGFRKDLIVSCVKQGYEVYAFISEYTQDWIEKIQSLGAKVITYTLSRGGLNPLADICSTLELKQKIQSIEPDIVFSYSVKPVIYGAIAAKLAKVSKNIGMLEGLGYTFTEQPNGQTQKAKLVKFIQICLYKLSLPLLDKLIFLNGDDPKDLLETYNISVKQTEILGGIGLHLDDYPYQPVQLNNTQINFLFIGRLLKEKGIYELIDAIKIVKKKYPEVVFTILGEIDHENMGALKQQELDELIQSNLIHYVGFVKDVQAYIKQSHVFILPSYREGVPRSTQEAMAIGRPIITTDVPGCRDTVTNEINGFLVPKWNTEILAEKIVYFIENPEQIRTMGDASYQIALKNFDAIKVNKRLISILVN